MDTSHIKVSLGHDYDSSFDPLALARQAGRQVRGVGIGPPPGLQLIGLLASHMHLLPPQDTGHVHLSAWDPTAKPALQRLRRGSVADRTV